MTDESGAIVQAVLEGLNRRDEEKRLSRKAARFDEYIRKNWGFWKTSLFTILVGLIVFLPLGIYLGRVTANWHPNAEKPPIQLEIK